MDNRCKLPLNSKYVYFRGANIGGNVNSDMYYHNDAYLRVNHNHHNAALNYNSGLIHPGTPPVGINRLRRAMRNHLLPGNVPIPVGVVGGGGGVPPGGGVATGNGRVPTKADQRRQMNEMTRMTMCHLNLIEEINEESIRKDNIVDELQKKNNELQIRNDELERKFEEYDQRDKERETVCKELIEREKHYKEIKNRNELLYLKNKELEEEVQQLMRQLQQQQKPNKRAASTETNSLPTQPQSKIMCYMDSTQNSTKFQPEQQQHLQHQQQQQISIPRKNTTVQDQYQSSKQQLESPQQHAPPSQLLHLPQPHHQQQQEQTHTHVGHSKINGDFNGRKVRTILMERVKNETNNQNRDNLDATISSTNIASTTTTFVDKSDILLNNTNESDEPPEEDGGSDSGEVHLVIAETPQNSQQGSSSRSATTVIKSVTVVDAQQVEEEEFTDETMDCDVQNQVVEQYEEVIYTEVTIETENDIQQDMETSDEFSNTPTNGVETDEMSPTQYIPMVSVPNTVLSDIGGNLRATTNNNNNMLTPTAHSTPTQQQQQQEQNEVEIKEIQDQHKEERTEQRATATVELKSKEIRKEKEHEKYTKNLADQSKIVIADVPRSNDAVKDIEEAQYKQLVTLKTQPQIKQVLTDNVLEQQQQLQNYVKHPHKKQVGAVSFNNTSSTQSNNNKIQQQQMLSDLHLQKKQNTFASNTQSQVQTMSTTTSTTPSIKETGNAVSHSPQQPQKSLEQKLQQHIQQLLLHPNQKKVKVLVENLKNDKKNADLIYPPLPQSTSTQTTATAAQHRILVNQSTTSLHQPVSTTPQIEFVKSTSTTTKKPIKILEDIKLPTIQTQQYQQQVQQQQHKKPVINHVYTNLRSAIYSDNSSCRSTQDTYASRAWEDRDFHCDWEFYLEEAKELFSDNPKLQIPKWNIVDIPAANRAINSGDNNKEDNSDEKYEERHRKLVLEEKKRKKQHEQSMKEQMRRLRELERENPVPEKLPPCPVSTFYPLIDDVEEVCFVTHVPVQAFGACVIRTEPQRSDFGLPWLKSSSNISSEDTTTSNNSEYVIPLGSDKTAMSATQRNQQQLNSSYVFTNTNRSKRQRNHANSARQRATKAASNRGGGAGGGGG